MIWVLQRNLSDSDSDTTSRQTRSRLTVLWCSDERPKVLQADRHAQDWQFCGALMKDPKYYMQTDMLKTDSFVVLWWKTQSTTSRQTRSRLTVLWCSDERPKVLHADRHAQDWQFCGALMKDPKYYMQTHAQDWQFCGALMKDPKYYMQTDTLKTDSSVVFWWKTLNTSQTLYSKNPSLPLHYSSWEIKENLQQKCKHASKYPNKISKHQKLPSVTVHCANIPAAAGQLAAMCDSSHNVVYKAHIDKASS